MVEESKVLVEEDESNIKEKEYVLDIFKDMFEHYKEKFSDRDLSDIEIADKFENNILPGFFDFALTCEHTFGSIVKPDISNYLAIKHGCWLNTIDFMTKYPSKNFQLAMGFIVHKDDLKKIKKDIESGYIPVYVDVIPHGFIVDNSGDVFDPTLGDNEDYHYFYKIVPEEIWKSFKYFYNTVKDWWVADFADWTKSQIREAKESHEFYKFVGLEQEADETENENEDEDVSQEFDTVKIEVRNDRGELVDFENTELTQEDSDRNAKGVVQSSEEPTVVNNSVFDKDNEPLDLNRLFDSVQESVLTEASNTEEESLDKILEGDFGLDDNIPSDAALEKRIDDYIEYCSKNEFIRTRSGHIFKKSEDGSPLDNPEVQGDKRELSGYKKVDVAGKPFFIPTTRADFINKQIDAYGDLIKNVFIKAINDAQSIKNTTTTIALQGIGTFDSAATTYYPFGQGEKSKYSKDAVGLDEQVPFYLTYLQTCLDSDGNTIYYDGKNKPANIARSLSIVQPRSVYQYRIQVPNASLPNKPVRYDITTGKTVETKKVEVVKNIGNKGKEKLSLIVTICNSNEKDSLIKLLSDKNISFYRIDDNDGISTIYSFIGEKDEAALNYAHSVGGELKYTKEKFVVKFNRYMKTCKLRDLKKKPNQSFYEVMVDGEFNKKDSSDPVAININMDDLNGYFILSEQHLPKELLEDVDKEIPISNNFFLNKLKLTEEKYCEEWLKKVPLERAEQSNLMVAKFDPDFVCTPVAKKVEIEITPSDPQMKDYDIADAKDYHTFQWLQRDFATQKRRLEYDEQIHRMKSACDEERAIPGFVAISKENIVEFSESEFENDKGWILQQLCNTEDWHSLKKDDASKGLLEQLFLHYAMTLNIKLRYYLDALQRADVGGETILIGQPYQGIVDITSVNKIGDTTEFKDLDNYISGAVTQSILGLIGKNVEDKSIEGLLLNQVSYINAKRNEEQEKNKEVILNKLEDEISNNENIKGNVIYAEKTDTNSLKLYQIYNKKTNKLEDYKGKVDIINNAFVDINTGKPAYCFEDKFGDIQLMPIEEYIETQRDYLDNVRLSYEKGDHGLFSDIARVVQFGFNSKCYKEGKWLKVSKDNIINTISPISFGTSDYNSIVDRLNTFFQLPESFLPATATKGDLAILREKLDSCMGLMAKFHETFNEKEYHLHLVKNEKVDDSEESYETNNQSFYDKLYSKGKKDDETGDIKPLWSEQENDWNKLCQYINVDIYPLIMEDEYVQLREAAKSQRRMYVKIRMTTKMKEIATRIANVPWDFTTKSILFTALKNYSAVKGVSSEFKAILDSVKNGIDISIPGTSWMSGMDDYSHEEKKDLTNNIKTSSAFTNASNKNLTEVFVRQMDKIKDSSAFSFMSKLLYQNLSDDEIWKLKDEVYEAFGYKEKPAQNKDVLNANKDNFVSAMKQFVLKYQIYKTSKITDLREKLEKNKYTLRDLNTYYKTRINEVIGGLSAFVRDFKEGRTDKNKSLRDEVLKSLAVVMSNEVKKKEERIEAMEHIIQSSDIVGEDKYLWLLSQFDELSGLYQNFKESKKEINAYIEDEVKKNSPTNTNDEGKDTDVIIHRYNDKFGETFSFNLTKAADQLCKDIVSTWNISMFDGFKKAHPDIVKSEEEKETESYPFVVNSNKISPNMLESWNKIFKPEGEQKKKLEKFINFLKSKIDLNNFKNYTKGQIETILNDAYEDTTGNFENAIKTMKRINNLQHIAEEKNIFSFANVGKEREHIHDTNQVHVDDFIANSSKGVISGAGGVFDLNTWLNLFPSFNFTQEQKEKLSSFIESIKKKVLPIEMAQLDPKTLADLINIIIEGKEDSDIRAEYFLLKKLEKDTSQYSDVIAVDDKGIKHSKIVKNTVSLF